MYFAEGGMACTQPKAAWGQQASALQCQVLLSAKGQGCGVESMGKPQYGHPASDSFLH